MTIPLELLLILIAFVMPAVLAMRCYRLMLHNKRENIRLRLEVGKLADELEQARKQRGTRGDSQAES